MNEPQRASLGDRVWKDTNKNGIQDTGEAGVAGVVVTLWSDDDSNGTPDTNLGSTTTDANGFYGFNNLDPLLIYIVEFEQMPTMPFTGQNQGSDDTVDSDVDPNTGFSAPITLQPGENNPNIDAGMIDLVPAIDISKDAEGDNTRTVAYSENVTFTITVTNTGDVPLTNVRVSDGLAPDCARTIGSLAIGEVVSYDCTVNNVTTGFTNVATVDGEYNGQNVSDTDNSTVEVNEPQRASLGDRVWKDTNKNGIQDAGEAGVAGVVVTLWVDDDNDGQADRTIATDTTDTNGFYGFNNLDPLLTYIVQFEQMPTMPFTGQNQGSDDTVDSDVDPNTGFSAPITLQPGENNSSVDAGMIDLVPAIDIRKDAEGDNTRTVNMGSDVTFDIVVTNTGDVPLSNVVVSDPLAENCSRVIGDLAVGQSVSYSCILLGLNSNITNVAMVEGSYNGQTVGDVDSSSIQVSLTPAPSLDIRKDAEGENTRSITRGSDVSFEIVVTNTGNVPLSNVRVADALAPDCARQIGELAVGLSFSYTCVLNNVQASLTNIATADGEYNGQNVSDTDPSSIEVTEPQRASLGDRVWKDSNQNGVQDAGEAGVASITVNLWVDDNSDDLPDRTVASTTTDDNGFYSFTDLEPGVAYIVQFEAMPSMPFTSQDQGANDAADSDANPDTGITAPVVLQPGENNPTIDAGLIDVVSSLGDRVWKDANENGIQDAGEVGVAGVSVNLWVDDNNDGTPDRQVASTITDDNGFYNFTDLDPELIYFVQFELMTSMPYVTPDQGADDSLDSDVDPTTGFSGPIDLAPGENNPTIDAGMIDATASLGDRVWKDANENGIQDAGEAGVSGITVNLWVDDNSDGLPDRIVANTVTDENGFYSFTNLEPGVSYIVQFEAMPSMPFTSQDQGTDDSLDSDANPTTGITAPVILQPGENNSTIDAGLIDVVTSLGDRVWKDTNNNGIQDEGEAGVSGVTINLWVDDNNDGTPDRQIASTVTDANGFYSFTNLDPELTYFVQFELMTSMPYVAPNQGTDDTVDSDADPTTGFTGPINLSPGENNPTIDAGMTDAIASLGDRVWKDANENGIQDEGEAGVAGIRVNLWVDDNNDGMPDRQVATTVTDENGFYSFTNLEPGIAYIVQFEAMPSMPFTSTNQGDDDALDSDVNPNTGITAPIILAPGENNTTIDAGLIDVMPLIGLAKVARTPERMTDANGVPIYLVTYDLIIRNYGDVALSNVQVTDDLDATFAPAPYQVVSVSSTDIAVNSNFNGSSDQNLLLGTDTLAAGASAGLSFSVAIPISAITEQRTFNNTAIVSATTPEGTTVTDVSTDGVDPDPDNDSNPSNNSVPTPVTLEPVPLTPEIGLAKYVSRQPVANSDGSYSFEYTLIVENTGETVLNNVQVTDDLANTFSVAQNFRADTVTSSDLSINPNYDGQTDINLLIGTDSLAVGARATIIMSVTVNPGQNYGPYLNSATAKVLHQMAR
ncbi:MAG: SdrD B-like domain-containing protein [Deinococcales bacterium]